MTDTTEDCPEPVFGLLVTASEISPETYGLGLALAAMGVGQTNPRYMAAGLLAEAFLPGPGDTIH